MSQSGEHLDVLVAGAGPTGLTLAAELARHGASVRLVDTPDEHERISKATALMPRTLELFDRAGVIEPFLDAGVKLAGLTLYAGHRRIFELTSADIDSPYPFVLGLEQFRTEEILADHAVKLGITIERSTSLTAFSADSSGVSATLSHADGSDEIVRARYLVGCDGAHSFVRHSLGLPFEGATMTDDRFAVAYLPIEWELPADRLLEFHSPSGTVIATPLPGGLWSIMFELDPTESAGLSQDAPTLSDLQSIMDARSPVAARLAEPLWVTYFSINHRQVPAYRSNRVFLAGDAAHIHSPAGGQGMNTGMQDAFNLGWKLAQVCQGNAPKSLLDSYDSERRPVGRDVLRLTTELQSELDQRNRVMMAIRDHAIAGLNHAGIARRSLARVLGELSYHYRQSPIVHEDHAGSVFFRNEARHRSFADCRAFDQGPRAGDRAPDCPVVRESSDSGPSMRLFDLLRERQYALLLFEGTHQTHGSASAWPEMRSLIDGLAASHPDLIHPIVVLPGFQRPESMDWNGTIVQDGDGSLHHRFGARGQCLYLIRPDGYVAYRSEPIEPDMLSNYLARVFTGRTVS